MSLASDVVEGLGRGGIDQDASLAKQAKVRECVAPAVAQQAPICMVVLALRENDWKLFESGEAPDEERAPLLSLASDIFEACKRGGIPAPTKSWAQ